MKGAKRIALAGVSSALGTIFLVVSAYIPLMDMSFLVIASLAMLLPIAKNDYVGAGLCYISTSILGLLITGNILKILPFIIFFGLHPLVYSLLEKTKIPIILNVILKLVFCNIAIFVAWKFLGLVVEISNFVFPYYLVMIAGSIGFLAYDYLIGRIKYILGYYIERLIHGKKK